MNLAKNMLVALNLMWFPIGSATAALAANNYAEGQVWEYETRREDAGSLLKIMRIDDLPDIGRVIHICVVGLKLPYPPAADGILVEVPELPMKPSAMDASVRKLSDRQASCMRLDYGYKTWRQDYDRGQKGAVPIPLKEMMEKIAAKAKQAQTP
jgi:hypothetical protein